MRIKPSQTNSDGRNRIVKSRRSELSSPFFYDDHRKNADFLSSSVVIFLTVDPEANFRLEKSPSQINTQKKELDLFIPHLPSSL